LANRHARGSKRGTICHFPATDSPDRRDFAAALSSSSTRSRALMNRLLKIVILAPIFTLAVLVAILCGVVSDLWSSAIDRDRPR